MEKTCWLKPENAHLRSAGYRNQNESGNSAVDQDGNGKNIEILLCAMTFPTDPKILNDPNVWIADTAASVHMTPHKHGLTKLQSSDTNSIIMGNGMIEDSTEVGTLPGVLCDQYGNELERLAIENVSYLPTANFNLFSITQMTAKGWILGGNDKCIWIEKGQRKVVFDMMIPTPRGVIHAMYFNRGTEVSGTATDKTTMTIQQAHERVGHPSKDATRKTAKELNWTITRGTMKPCEGCAAAKAKQKNVPKTSTMLPSNTTKDKSRIYLDIATGSEAS
jgi:hypothetical protein